LSKIAEEPGYGGDGQHASILFHEDEYLGIHKGIDEVPMKSRYKQDM
jgi:hypothetical protein